MWRSNVLRLRTCSSTFATHHVKKRWHSGNAAQAVSHVEFTEALDHAYSRSGPERDRVPTIGLAVSGGVDSMALATLYANAIAKDRTLPTCHAFIIDHKARPESTEEAEWVKEQLRWKLDIPATIIPLTWPEYNDQDSHARRFESDARRLRYQALGQACNEHKIEKLLVAHHADDQAETVLMRLMNMRWRSGLQGMQAADWIPECYGMHGVYHSGVMQMNKNLPMQVERGGIQILRPLLRFRKDRLITTCESHQIPWAEDKSNQDHTLTLRNAIRHVFKEHRLPEALSFEALLALGDEMKGRVEHHKDVVERLLKTREVICKLDVQTGSLSVRFPPAFTLLGRPIISEQDVDEVRNTAYMLLVRIAGFVDFRDNTSIGKLSGVVSAVWPELRHDSKNVPDATNPSASVCAFGLFWRKWNQPNPPHLPKSVSGMVNPMDWLVSRQPPESHELGRTGLRLEYPPMPATVPLIPTPDTSLPRWRLFDRWWFQVRNLTQTHTIVLRFVTDEELLTLTTRNKGSSRVPDDDPYYNIKACLNLVKPALLRRNLPALFLVTPEGQEELLAVPTLGVKTIYPKDGSFPNPPCLWDVRYKKIDSRHGKLNQVIAPAVRPHDKSFAPKKRPTFKRTDAIEDGKRQAQWSAGKRTNISSHSKNMQKGEAKAKNDVKSGRGVDALEAAALDFEQKER